MSQRPVERDDLDVLLDPLLRFAQHQLRTRDEYFPFGNWMRSDGAWSMVASTMPTEHPLSQEVIDELVTVMRERAAAGEIKAIGICYDVRTTGTDGKKTDAIAVALEHRAGDAVLGPDALLEAPVRWPAVW
jgi:hypothetical protein